MAEALGVAASVIAVIQLTGSVIKICYNYQSTARHASEEIKCIRNQLLSLHIVLDRLISIVENEPHRLPTLELLSEPDGPLIILEAELRTLKTKLKPASGWKEKGRALVWPLQEKDMRKTLFTIENMKATIHLALTADQTSLTLAIQNSVTAVHDSVKENFTTLTEVAELSKLDKLRQQIYQWLSPPDPSSNHNDARQKRKSATGTWFLESKEFADWKSNPDSILWLHGLPGCGKTILCSTIIQEVALHCETDSSLVFAYFYFTFSDEKKQSLDHLIRSLILQFSHRSTSSLDVLTTVYSQNQDGQRQPDTGDLKKTLSSILACFDHAYIILDALDECANQEELLAFLKEIADWKLGKLHILATSRKEKIIEDCLRIRATYAIDLQSALVDPDIATYIRETLQHDGTLNKWPPDVQQEVKLALIERAHGMFRWVACQLEVLRECLNRSDMRRALDSLPETLDQTYDRILMNIRAEHRDSAFKVLQWLTFSARPVTLAELTEVLAVNYDGKPRFDADLRLFDPCSILRICSSLVTISSLEEYESQYAGVLKLAHFSVKEYLVSPRIRTGVASWCSLDKRLADTFISHTCLVYLLQFDQLDSLDSRTTSRFPLARYAAEYWIRHGLSENHAIPDVLQDVIMDLLQPQHARFINWVRLCDIDDHSQRMNLTKSSSSIASPLYYASLAGLQEASLRLMQCKGVDINAYGGKYESPLMAASAEGHEAIVRLLVDRGAYVNVQGGDYDRSALVSASRRGHEAIARLLVERGVYANAQGRCYESSTLEDASARKLKGESLADALVAALDADREAIARLLLDNGADANAQGGMYGNALLAASHGGNEANVRLLLEKGAKVNAEGGVFGNALQAASVEGHETIVRLLLDNGANVNAQGGYYGNALEAASYSGEEAIMQLLLDKGATNVKSNDNARGT